MTVVRRLLRMVPMAAKPLPPAPGVWGRLSTPVDPGETQTCIRAQSILSGPLIGACPPLSIDQARDVLAWFNPATTLRK